MSVDRVNNGGAVQAANRQAVAEMQWNEAQKEAAKTTNDGKITVVDLNSAMGWHHNDKNTAKFPNGGLQGLDFNDTDMNQAINDLFGNGRDPDVITMQEVALSGATGTDADTNDIGELKGIKQRLEERTGDTWNMYASFGNDTPQYYRAEPGRVDGDGIKSRAGTVIFVREGPGSDVQSSSAILPSKTEINSDSYGADVKFSNTILDSSSLGGSLLGVRIVTKEGNKPIDIYTSHTSEHKIIKDKGVNEGKDLHEVQVNYARDRIKTYSGDNTVIWTGDFNSGVNDSKVLKDVIRKDGFYDASAGAGNTGSWTLGRYWKHLDHIFVRGLVEQPEANAFEAPSSDHKGLVISLDPAKDLPPSK